MGAKKKEVGGEVTGFNLPAQNKQLFKIVLSKTQLRNAVILFWTGSDPPLGRYSRIGTR